MRLVPLAAAALALAAAAPAAAASPQPFGHPCSASQGARVCPTASDAARVASFDGVPLDVDAWLPPRGNGPFPTLVILHGFGGSKLDGQSSQSSATYSAAFYARRGYAVVLPSARGFGRSCGVPDSRTAGCERGWLHLGDQRYEARDVQWLLGTLVDEGIARSTALAATGLSYGGGLTLTLAALADRIRRPYGSFARWRSPAGRRLRLAAAYARIPWSDLADALVPNGRLLAPGARLDAFADPVGVPIEQYLNGLFTVATTSGFVAPQGADPGADLRAWHASINRGEPYGGRVRRILGRLHRYHGALGVPPTRPAPLLIQSGWTDDLFPAGQGLRMYEAVRRRAPGAYVSLQLGDLGHDRGGHHRLDTRAMELGALRFFDRFVKGGRSAGAPRSGSVVAFGQSCPKDAPRGAGPWRAASYAGLARGVLAMRPAAARQRVTSSAATRRCPRRSRRSASTPAGASRPAGSRAPRSRPSVRPA